MPALGPSAHRHTFTRTRPMLQARWDSCTPEEGRAGRPRVCTRGAFLKLRTPSPGWTKGHSADQLLTFIWAWTGWDRCRLPSKSTQAYRKHVSFRSRLLRSSAAGLTSIPSGQRLAQGTHFCQGSSSVAACRGNTLAKIFGGKESEAPSERTAVKFGLVDAAECTWTYLVISRILHQAVSWKGLSPLFSPPLCLLPLEGALPLLATWQWSPLPCWPPGAPGQLRLICPRPCPRAGIAELRIKGTNNVT